MTPAPCEIDLGLWSCLRDGPVESVATSARERARRRRVVLIRKHAHVWSAACACM